MAEASTKPSGRSDEAAAADLCVLVLRNGKTEGRFMMEVDQLIRGADLPRDQFEAAKAWAVEHGWLQERLENVELKAAGIHVAKKVLDLPR